MSNKENVTDIFNEKTRVASSIPTSIPVDRPAPVQATNFQAQPKTGRQKNAIQLPSEDAPASVSFLQAMPLNKKIAYGSGILFVFFLAAFYLTSGSSKNVDTPIASSGLNAKSMDKPSESGQISLASHSKVEETSAPPPPMEEDSHVIPSGNGMSHEQTTQEFLNRFSAATEKNRALAP